MEEEGRLNSEMLVRRLDELETKFERIGGIEEDMKVVKNTVNTISLKVDEGLSFWQSGSRNIGSSGVIALSTTSLAIRDQRDQGKKIGGELCEIKSTDHNSNLLHVRTFISTHEEFFEPISARYPKFDVMLARLLVNSFGFAVGKIDASVRLIDFKDRHSETVAKSVATLLRKRKTAEVALDAWRKQFT